MDLEARISRARDLLLRAPLDRNWPAALDALAAASGARLGQLVAQGRDDLRLNWITGIDPAEQALAEAAGLADPDVNPRLRAGRRGDILEVLADQDYAPADLRTGYPIYSDIFDKFGFSFNCQSVLLRAPGRLIRTSVSRSMTQGPFDRDALQVFAALAADVQSAVKLQIALEDDQGLLLAGALNAISSPTLLLDGYGKVLAITSAAERLLAAGDELRVRRSGLEATCAKDQRLLDTAVARATAVHLGDNLAANTTIILASSRAQTQVQLEIQALPRKDFSLYFDPAVIIVARRVARQVDWPVTFGLTRTEARVAEALARGSTPRQIAEDHGRSLATVRTQIGAAYDKLGVRRQIELAAKLLPLIEKP